MVLRETTHLSISTVVSYKHKHYLFIVDYDIIKTIDTAIV